MSIFKRGKSISGKVFIASAVISIVVCIVSVSVTMHQSRAIIGNAIEYRDIFWSQHLSNIAAAANEIGTQAELRRMYAEFKDTCPEIMRLELIDTSGKVLMWSADQAGEGVAVPELDEQQASADGDMPADMNTVTIRLPGKDGNRIRITFADSTQETTFSELRSRILVIGIVSLIAGFALFYMILYYAIRQPLRKLLLASQSLASNAGDLTGKIDIGSEDELGKFGCTLNDIFYNLSGIINMIRTTADKVNFSAQGLSAATEQMNSITEETSMTVQNIAKSTDLQAHKVEDMIKEIKNMERSVKQVANSAELAASAATNASETATKGSDSAGEAVEKINEIYNVINDSAEIIRHLGERSNQIGEIVDVITDVADQTNLLALNAAIEAARAGEAGSGFAVVADEVRKLAEGSAKAADEIAALIRQTQQDTQTAVKSIELGAKEVTEGKDVITRTGASLDEIVEVLKSSSDMARRISAATNELSRGMKNVISSIDEISASAEKNASATQETAASMEQMTSSMEDVASSAQKLSDMAIQLRENVGRFKITEIGQDEGNVIAWSDVLKGE